MQIDINSDYHRRSGGQILGKKGIIPPAKDFGGNTLKDQEDANKDKKPHEIQQDQGKKKFDGLGGDDVESIIKKNEELKPQRTSLVSESYKLMMERSRIHKDFLMPEDEKAAKIEVIKKKQERVDKKIDIIMGKMAKAERDRVKVFANMRKKILSGSKISKADSVSMAGSVKYHKTEKDVKKWTAEFYHLTGGKARSVTDVYNGPKTWDGGDEEWGRAAHWRVGNGTSYINTGKSITKSTQFHEMAHALERDDKSIFEAAVSWRNTKAKSLKQKKLSEITGIYSYGDEETALEDGFFHAYLGKVYDGKYTKGSTEVVSMALQHFDSPANMEDLYKKDKELFYLGLQWVTK